MLLFRKRSLETPQAFTPWIYDTKTSLASTIDQLSDKKREITDGEVFNLVVKYFVNFIVGDLEYEKIPEWEVHKRYLWLQEFTKKEWWIWGNEIPRELVPINPIYYQLSMLWCPSTLSIVKSIISEKVEDILWNREYRSLDLWAGSGILSVAFYIKWRRSGLIPNMRQSIWIEINEDVVIRSNRILHKLWIGRILKWNTAKVETYQSLKIPRVVHDIGNENLPNAFSPLYVYEKLQEPFLMNLRALEGYLETLEKSSFFPKMTTFWVQEKARAEWVPFSFPVLSIWPNIVESLEKINAQEKLLRESGNYEKIDSFLHPEWIKIRWKFVSLEEVGNEYIISENSPTWYFYQSDFMPRRWIFDSVGAAYFYR